MNNLPAANPSLVAAMRAQNRATDKAIDAVAGLTLADVQSPEKALEKVNGNAPNIPRTNTPYANTSLLGLNVLTGQEHLEWGELDGEHGDPVKDNQLQALQIRTRAVQMSSKLQEENFTIQDAAPYRIILAYRLIRELGRLQGDFSADAVLEDTCLWDPPRKISPNKTDIASQEEYVKYLRSSSASLEPFHKKRRAAAEGLMVEILQIQQELELSRIPYEPPGSSLDGLEESMETSEAFCYVMEAVSESLGMQMGSKLLPAMGVQGLPGLFNVGTVRLLWPSRSEILYFEDLLLEEVTRKFTANGDSRARTFLSSKYGMMPHETAEVLRLALRRTKDTVIDDSEIMKAKAVMRLEHLYNQAGKTLDIRAQLQAIKMQSDLLDLNQSSRGSEVDDIISAMQKTALERDIEEAKEDGRDHEEFEAELEYLE